MGILQSIYNDRLGAHFASPREFATRAPDTILLTPFAVERRLGLSHVRYFDRSRLPNQCFNSRKSVTWFSLGCSFFPGKRSVLHSRSKKGGLAEINQFFWHSCSPKTTKQNEKLHPKSQIEQKISSKSPFPLARSLQVATLLFLLYSA